MTKAGWISDITNSANPICMTMLRPIIINYINKK